MPFAEISVSFRYQRLILVIMGAIIENAISGHLHFGNRGLLKHMEGVMKVRISG